MKISNATAAYGADKWAVFLVSFDESGQILEKVADLNIPEVRWFGTDSLTMSNVISSNHKAAEFAAASNFTASIQGFYIITCPSVPLMALP